MRRVSRGHDQHAATPDAVTVPGTIDATGATDVTAALLAYFATVPDGTNINFPASGVYRIEGTLVLSDRNIITIDGNGSQFVATTVGTGSATAKLTRSHWRLVRCGWVRLTDMTVTGANPVAGQSDAAYNQLYEAQHCFEVEGSHHIEIDHCTATDPYGDFVNVKQGNRPFPVPDTVWVHHNTFTRNGRQGVAITSGNNVTIENNTISEVRRSTLDIEPTQVDRPIDTVMFRNNTIGPGRLNFIASGAESLTGISNITITGNTLTGKEMNILVFAVGTMRAATTTTLPSCTYANGASGAGATLTGTANGALTAQDGVTLLVNERLLVKDQTDGTQNGPYELTQVGDSTHPFILTRVDYADTASTLPTGTWFSVSEGTVNHGTAWEQSSHEDLTIGTTALVFTTKTTSEVHGRRGSWTITNNTSDTAFGSPLAALTFTNIDTVTVTGNTVALQDLRSQVFVRTTACCNVTVSGNTITTATDAVIRVDNQQNYTCP